MRVYRRRRRWVAVLVLLGWVLAVVVVVLALFQVNDLLLLGD